jgi:hypothetical protein
MRLEPMLVPDAQHARVADAHPRGHHGAARSSTWSWRGVPSPFSRLKLDGGVERLPSGRLEPFDTGLGEVVLPAPDGGLRNSGLAHNRDGTITARHHQNDPHPFGDLLTSVPIGEQPLRFSARLPRNWDSSAATEH